MLSLEDNKQNLYLILKLGFRDVRLKTLGVLFDTRRSFRSQIKASTAGAKATTTALVRLMSNISGPYASRRRLLMLVVNSKQLYAVSIWVSGLDLTCNQHMLIRPQRQVAIRIAKA